jgi:glyoxalase family protein
MDPAKKLAKRLEGIHHITAITGDAARNVEFYAGTLGLRMVKKSVNQDDPTIYHLFYADEEGDAGSDITFFEYPGAARGRAGAGMVHRIVWRLPTGDALDFWQDRMETIGISVERSPDAVRFSDPEGLELEFRVVSTPDPPLIADHPEVPREFALQGFDGARAFTASAAASRPFLLEGMAFDPADDASYEIRGEQRGSWWAYDETTTRGVQGAGTVHHIAWAAAMDDHLAWRERVSAAGASPTPVIDRFWFRSIYFREPSGVLFEIATLGPGFGADEDMATLGETLSLPPDYEHLREQLADRLTPLPDVAAWRRERAGRPS